MLYKNESILSGYVSYVPWLSLSPASLHIDEWLIVDGIILKS